MPAFAQAWTGVERLISAWRSIFSRRHRGTLPDAAILVTGVEDPDAELMGLNESLHLAEFERVCLAETYSWPRTPGQIDVGARAAPNKREALDAHATRMANTVIADLRRFRGLIYAVSVASITGEEARAPFFSRRVGRRRRGRVGTLSMASCASGRADGAISGSRPCRTRVGRCAVEHEPW